MLSSWFLVTLSAIKQKFLLYIIYLLEVTNIFITIVGILLEIIMNQNVYLMILILYSLQVFIWSFCLITIRAEFLFLGRTTIHLKIFSLIDLLINLIGALIMFWGLSSLEFAAIFSCAIKFIFFLYCQLCTNDIQERRDLHSPLINNKQIVVKKRVFKKFNGQRYKPFYYNSTYNDSQVCCSPQFVNLPEEERQTFLQKSEEEKKNNQITEIFVTGWEVVEKYINENLSQPCLTFIIEFERKNEIYFTKRTLNEFIELFKSLQKHTRYLFPKLKQNKLENQSPKDLMEIFSKILQVVNIEQIGKHINFQQFLMPRDKLEEFVVNQVETFANNNMNETPQSYQKSSDASQRLESLRRKCSASPQQLDLSDSQVVHTMSFGQQNLQKQVSIDILFSKTDNRPKYEQICVIDWDYGEPDESFVIVHGRSNLNTEIDEDVYFLIKFTKYKKNIPQYYVKRSLKDFNQLRDYYELIYESRQFPSLTQPNKSINNVNKESFRHDSTFDSLKNQINDFFDYLIQNQLTSLNLKKFLEENSQIFDENENYSNQNLESDSSHFMKNGNLN
ncbi:hypothetical protein ABPG74_021449 [Tetrahymena malaccensis]